MVPLLLLLYAVATINGTGRADYAWLHRYHWRRQKLFTKVLPIPASKEISVKKELNRFKSLCKGYRNSGNDRKTFKKSSIELENQLS